MHTIRHRFVQNVVKLVLKDDEERVEKEKGKRKMKGYVIVLFERLSWLMRKK